MIEKSKVKNIYINYWETLFLPNFISPLKTLFFVPKYRKVRHRSQYYVKNTFYFTCTEHPSFYNNIFFSFFKNLSQSIY